MAASTLSPVTENENRGPFGVTGNAVCPLGYTTALRDDCSGRPRWVVSVPSPKAALRRCRAAGELAAEFTRGRRRSGVGGTARRAGARCLPVTELGTEERQHIGIELLVEGGVVEARRIRADLGYGPRQGGRTGA